MRLIPIDHDFLWFGFVQFLIRWKNWLKTSVRAMCNNWLLGQLENAYLIGTHQHQIVCNFTSKPNKVYIYSYLVFDVVHIHNSIRQQHAERCVRCSIIFRLGHILIANECDCCVHLFYHRRRASWKSTNKRSQRNIIYGCQDYVNQFEKCVEQRLRLERNKNWWCIFTRNFKIERVHCKFLAFFPIIFSRNGIDLSVNAWKYCEHWEAFACHSINSRIIELVY